MVRPDGPVAQLAGVCHRYGAGVALESVDLAFPGGKAVGLIGPDGVGKSTLLGLIAGVRRLQQGSVHVLGADLSDRAQRIGLCTRIAYMPQGLGRNLYGTLSVHDNLDFFARLFGQQRVERRERVRALLDATGLLPFADRVVDKLSGGMKQKLGLCCALVHDPDLLILDEPTTGVDPLSRRRFWELIGQIRSQRPAMGVIIATAYMEEAERFDWLVAMSAGRVLATGSPAEILTRTHADSLEDAFVALLPEGLGRETSEKDARVPQSGGEIAIEARALTRRFGSFTAVDGVSFRICRGEIFGFLGSNGCGKTTTMRMLTGLLPASEGEARLFGQAVDTDDLQTRKRVGFMSQSFSLYRELTVQQNLVLHARLFHLPAARIGARVDGLAQAFGLGPYLDRRAEDVPLGVRQRLSLAVAVIHEPELLILDEPTSGVDPGARDRFWDRLVDLSRNQSVTIFISTHFMTEAERCDRISFMHAGRVLAQGTPAALKAQTGCETLEDAFIAYLKASSTETESLPETGPPIGREGSSPAPARFSPRRLWAYARREAMELWRDPIRLAFALLGPVVLMLGLGYGISFDVDRLPFAVLNLDGSPESRAYVEQFAASRYFRERRPIGGDQGLDRRLRSGELSLALEIPPDFGREVSQGRRPEVGVWIDGSVPFRAETILGYLQAVHRAYVKDLMFRLYGEVPELEPLEVETRFRYNQAFRSVYAMVPGIAMLLLILIPSTMTAVGVVREKELGSITNLYATPVTGTEFLLGKQLPYIGVSLINYITLVVLALGLFGVPIKGSVLGLTVGALLFVIASTGLGLLMSTFVRSQIAAVFGTAIVSALPTILFSGFLSPLSSLGGGARVMGYGFPSAWFHHVSIGAFTKGLGPADLLLDYLVLALFGLAFLSAGRLLLRTQER
jgi:ribosome-dependent ATPase